MIDFSKLRHLTEDEIAIDDENRRQRQIREVTARRTEWSRRSIAATLTDDAERRFGMDGASEIQIRGIQADRKPLSGQWYAPEHFTRDQADRLLDSLTAGRQITLDGYWKAFTPKDGKTRFSFYAQFIHLPDGQRVP